MAVAKKKAVTGKAVLVKKDPKGVETVEEETVGEPKMLPEDQICHVGFKLGYTKNLGNYESLRIDVSIDMPGYPHEIDAISAFEYEWVQARMEEAVEKVEQELSE